MMTRSDEAAGDDRDGWFMYSAATIGDLSNPFNAEERERDVWNEASAVGLQTALWLGMIAANLMVWLGGGGGLPYAIGVYAVVTAANCVAVAYARRLRVEAEDTRRLLRWPAVPTVLLTGLFLLGVARVATVSPAVDYGLIGFSVGGLIGLGWTLTRALRRREQPYRHPRR